MSFLLVTCQIGVESALKAEMAARGRGFHLAYSRPGFLTFKLPSNVAYADDFDASSVFARACAFSLGKVTGNDDPLKSRTAWELARDLRIRRIHVWPRDQARPGSRGYEPQLTPAAYAVHRRLWENRPQAVALAPDADEMRTPASRGELILDCVLVGADEWWIGYHRAGLPATRWPGGMLDLQMPADAVSRAWLKMEEALRWSELPIPPNARVAELGSSPGGASQALLARGYWVSGVDPAEMHPAVLAHPHFTHIRRRSTQVRRREFRKVRWLMADMNVAPRYTLNAVESIVCHPEVSIRGMLLTLKLTDLALAAQIPAFLAQIRSWGFNEVRARQLQHNHREVCVAALQRPFRRKS